MRQSAGGLAARRAVVRWAWRMFRREWRQQTLVLALLALAVAAATFTATAAYNAAESPAGEFGTANQMFTLDGSDPRGAADVAAIEEWFGSIDVIGRRDVAVPGSVDAVELRAQDPRGPYSAPMLTLLDGRYPTGTDEVAVTDVVATTFGVDVGGELVLDGVRRAVVGLVENSARLDDEFALVAPTAKDSRTMPMVTILTVGSAERFASFEAANQASWGHEWRYQSESTVLAAGVFGLATVAMVFVALVAATGFVVVAQRRLRQLGMLAAIGASDKHLRLVVLANGALIGALAAVIGAPIGLACWFGAAPRLESVAGRRIDRLDVPWWLIGFGVLLSLVTASAAAWWPARAMSRIPVTLALSARTPRPRALHRSAGLAGLLIVAGIGCLALANRTTTLLIGAGTLATVAGVLLVSPLAIRALAAGAARLPIAVRLPTRDLARYQARSGAALAAITLALGIPAATVIVATAAEPSADEGNLADHQLLIRIGDLDDWPNVRTSREIESLQIAVDRIADGLGEPAVFTLNMVVDPTNEPVSEGGERWLPAVQIGDAADTSRGPLYVATPGLLERYGVDADALDRDIDVVTAQTGRVGFRNLRVLEDSDQVDVGVVSNVERIDADNHTSAPTSLITRDAMRRRGWEPARKGWFIEADEPLTSGQLMEARALAADAGLTVEARDRDRQQTLAALRSGATIAGMVVALCVLAMTVGLIRNEAAGDLRTLTATGATSTIRRMLTAATAGSLGLLGATLATVGAYVGLAAGYVGDIGTLGQVPVLHLLAMTVGVPVAAASAGWLLAGREPAGLARQAME